MPRAALICSLLLLLAGCQTVEKVRLPSGEWKVVERGGKDFEDTPEGKLVAAAEENPEQAKVWYDLGRFYEERRMFVKALRSYEQMQAAIEKDEARTGQTYVGGLYLLGKTHALLKNWRPAVGYLRKVLESQPENLKQASVNPYFRETHFLLGAIYFEHRLWEPSERHLITFQELNQGRSDGRADSMLMEINDQVRPGKSDGERRPVARLTGKEGTLVIEESPPAKASAREPAAGGAAPEDAAEPENPAGK
jgi:tetratricopeptide (TPR) repeat protein